MGIIPDLTRRGGGGLLKKHSRLEAKYYYLGDVIQ